MSEPATLVNVEPDGRLTFIWDDALACLGDEGQLTVRRASWVEPTADGQWEADLAPSGGPKLGPFKLRREALAAEREWLEANAERVS